MKKIFISLFLFCSFFMVGSTFAQLTDPAKEKGVIPKYALQSAEFPDDVFKSGASVNYIERFYDDWVAENYAAWQMAGNMNAVKFSFPPYPLTVVGANIYVGDGSFPAGGNFLNKSFRISVYANDGENGMPGTLIDSITALAKNYEWVPVIGLNATVTSDFYIVMTQLSNSPDCVPLGVDETVPKANCSYSRNVLTNGPWVLSPYQDFMIHVFLTGTVGLEERKDSDAVKIIPNPAHESVKLEDVSVIKSLVVYSASGEIVSEANLTNQPVFSINTSHYLSGIYFIRFTTSNGGSFVRKLVIVH